MSISCKAELLWLTIYNCDTLRYVLLAHTQVHYFLQLVQPEKTVNLSCQETRLKRLHTMSGSKAGSDRPGNKIKLSHMTIQTTEVRWLNLCQAKEYYKMETGNFFKNKSAECSVHLYKVEIF